MTKGFAFIAGARDCLAAPAWVLAASFLGFGSLVHAGGLDPVWGVISTLSTFALPGQMAMVELHVIGGSPLAVLLAVALANVRLLPMVLVLMPWFPNTRLWHRLLLSHAIAVTGWVQALKVFPDLPGPARVPYFWGFFAVLGVAAIGGTWTGFHLAGQVPAAVSLGLVFLNPVYFMIVLSADLAATWRRYAFGLGALAGPPAFLLSPDWGLLLAGLAAGTAAFVITRPDREGKP